MRELGIDIETYSSYDLTEVGVYKYVEAPDFEILLFSYCEDGGEVRCIDIASGEQLPEHVLQALTDENVIKTAYNATFERVCLSRFLHIKGFLDPTQWRCTMVQAARMGLPLSLAQCGDALGLEKRKMTEGRALIRFFSLPHKKTKDGKVTYERYLPTKDAERWETFKAYNIRDVEVEQEILRRVRRLEAPQWDERLYQVDQRINDRGTLLDMELVGNAYKFDEQYKGELMEEAKEITGLENPNSPEQIKTYIAKRTGFRIESLSKKKLDDYEVQFKYWKDVQQLLAIRRELGKTSNKKYDTMRRCVCEDGRVHGLLQFQGAARTGRWAGRLVQIQNLPQNHLPDIDLARELVRQGNLAEFEMNYENVTQVLSELIRTAFIAKRGCVFHVCDFSAIEARVIAWLAGEEWVLRAFREGRDIYCETASRMFGVPVEKHGINASLRQRGKVAVLGLGYGGGVSALEAMGGARLGLTDTEMRDVVTRWRDNNRNIVKLWNIVERAAIAAIKTKRSIMINRGVTVECKWGCLLIKLPSGRHLCYPRARVITETNQWGRESEQIEYEGANQTTKKWEKTHTYGGKLTENIIQAIARDILGHVLLQADERGLNVVFHIHDEIVVEAEQGQTLEEVEALFSQSPDWCADLPLQGAGYSTPYYLKD